MILNDTVMTDYIEMMKSFPLIRDDVTMKLFTYDIRCRY